VAVKQPQIKYPNSPQLFIQSHSKQFKAIQGFLETFLFFMRHQTLIPHSRMMAVRKAWLKI
jgi:hypothetical protein